MGQDSFLHLSNFVLVCSLIHGVSVPESSVDSWNWIQVNITHPYLKLWIWVKPWICRGPQRDVWAQSKSGMSVPGFCWSQTELYNWKKCNFQFYRETRGNNWNHCVFNVLCYFHFCLWNWKLFPIVELNMTTAEGSDVFNRCLTSTELRHSSRPKGSTTPLAFRRATCWLMTRFRDDWICRYRIQR